ncbi:hypothetical protein BK659_21885 [Pseudomonas brassicacearum]|uniref:Toxin n=1 Tax=Pseudomonas brassicacearum TaxID=930166 RepID=A0A423H0K6_9PSED|nr:RHS repeat-associated core domain-containing protein [Pseudomonas brassicacearum]RON05267.1 hypothetical protein BK659_21885 [Pseudomonas brassicacearum]
MAAAQAKGDVSTISAFAPLNHRCTCYFLQYRSDEKSPILQGGSGKQGIAMVVQTSHDTATPTLSVMDPRGLAIRSVGYCRQRVEQAIDTRITRQSFDTAGRLIESWDPRLWGTASKPNLATVYDLTGQSLLTDSVDGGWQLGLLDETGQLLSSWDSRGSQRHTEYDGQQRPLEVREWTDDEQPCVVERFTYAEASEQCAVHNQCGQLIRHDDPAGTQRFAEYALNGQRLSEQRHFLLSRGRPDWPLDSDARDVLLETRSYVSAQVYTASGEIQSHADAKGNNRVFSHTRAGQLKDVRLQLADPLEPARLLVSGIRYSAFGQVESEMAGNGVKTSTEYATDDGRLTRLRVCNAAGKPYQDLHYCYDPVGNIRRIEDRTQSVRYFKNQQVEAISDFRYDSLYQLVEASAREVNTPSYGPALPVMQPSPLDPNQLRRYTRTFDYDRAGNLLSRHHSGTNTFTMFSSFSSNRSLAQHEDGSLPDEQDILDRFDACGNQRQLQRGQAMRWDARNQLREVTLVERDDGSPDIEQYVYDRPGHRLRKVRLTQAHSRTLLSEVRYLPGLEVHCNTANDEERHVISVEAGRGSVRVLHWPGERPKGLSNNLVRFGFHDHLGSSSLELDEDARVLSQEAYYPFGGTAWWAGENAIEAKYRTIRYSGKERDATGLYYYGYRYYAPWLQRWVSPDPAGSVDGLNLFKMVGNCPVNYYDMEGTNKVSSGIRPPVDVFVEDILNPGAKGLGTGWFEELVWNEQSMRLESVGGVYTRNMGLLSEGDSDWYHDIENSSRAFAVFLDGKNKPRLFMNAYEQHMGIQPGMGLPIMAGLLTVAPGVPSTITISNHSGHYKPDGAIDAKSYLSEIAPGATINYESVSVSDAFSSAIRLPDIKSPEEYVDLVNHFKGAGKQVELVEYLKGQGVWDGFVGTQSKNWFAKALSVMSETGASFSEAFNAHVAKETATATSSPQAAAQPSRRALSVRPPNNTPLPRQKHSSFFGGIRKIFGKR